MIIFKKAIAFFLLYTTYPLLCSGQSKIIYNEEKYRLQHYTDENGLPQNSIRNIAIDHLGFVWVATENGLVRYDGQNLDIYDKENLSVSTSNFFILGAYMDFSKPKNPIDITGNKLERTTWIPPAIHAGRVDNISFRIEDGKVKKEVLNSKTTRSADLSYQKNELTIVAQNTSIFKRQPPDHLAIPYAPGSYFLCSENKISFYTNQKKLSETSFHQNDITNFFTKSGTLFYAESDGTISSINQKSIIKLRITGDLLKNPTYEAHLKKYQIFWNITGDQVLFYAGKHLYEVSVNNRGEIDTKLILHDFDFVANDIVSAYFDSSHHRCFLGSRTKGLFVLTAKAFQSISIPVSRGDENNFYAQTTYGPASILTPGGAVLTKNMITGQIELKKLKLQQRRDHGNVTAFWQTETVIFGR